jgi:site-specific DNA-methyltransferase (cytosine-N4-specific)
MSSGGANRRVVRQQSHNPNSPAPGAPAAPAAGGVKGPPEVTVHLSDARSMAPVATGEVALVVTSPPYPMIAMWDDLFAGAGARTFEAMHAWLDGVWAEVARVLAPGGLACVVVGDALRSVNGDFQLFANHARVIQGFEEQGLTALPYILWKKPTNRPNAFLGSGFLPPNAYVTLDCEFILIFRKGGLRRFPPGDEGRRASTYTKADRDVWFSQLWALRGSPQVRGGLARRTASFPPEIPRRLISMFSVRGDLVLDPFVGTGTTLAQALRLDRRAVGFELDRSMREEIRGQVEAAGGSCRFGNGGPNR